MALYVGTSGFSFKEWKGTFYPEGLPPKEMLHFYGERFEAVEINNTFHRMPKVSLFEAWRDQVPPDFRFVLKAPQRITHIQRLVDVDDSVSYFFEIAGVLRERLGPVLFQLPSGFKKDLPRLRDFLSLLPPDRRAAMEFRHQSWFDEDVLRLLHERKVALCIAEAENDLDVPVVATAEWGYLRLRLPEYGIAELQSWIKRIREQMWRDTFVFFKHEDSGKGPLFARRLLELAGAMGPEMRHG